MIVIFICLLILLFLAGILENKPLTNIKGEWEQHIDFVGFSPQQFFQSIKEYIVSKNIKNVRISKIRRHQNGFFSPQREYLRIERKGVAFDIGAILYGNGIFLSWRLGQVVDELPENDTYYKQDTAKAFRKIVQKGVAATIDSLCHQQADRLQNSD